MTKPNRKPHAIYFDNPSLTKQAFAEEANINNIMAKYEKTGIIDNIKTHNGQYGDFSNITDYQTSLNQIMSAQTLFNSLPSTVRRQFNNDPLEFVEFTQDEKNIPVMEKMGLLEPTNTPPQTPPADKTNKADQPDQSHKKSPDKEKDKASG